MRAVDIIDKKKKRQELTKEEIDFLLEGYLAGTIPDYQMSAFLMAVYFNNMTKEELTYFTLKMRNSGDIIRNGYRKTFWERAWAYRRNY